MSNSRRNELQAVRFGVDQDPAIRFDISDPREAFCFELVLGPHRIKMHARSVIDLIHKGSIAYCDWAAMVAKEQLIELAKPGP